MPPKTARAGTIFIFYFSIFQDLVLFYCCMSGINDRGWAAIKGEEVEGEVVVFVGFMVFVVFVVEKKDEVKLLAMLM